MSEGTTGPRAAGMAKMDEVYGFSVALRRRDGRPPVRVDLDP
jgi:hypothetical protein